MRKQRIDSVRTRINLLEAASEIFALKGFWNTTHEEICSRAGTAAAINYYFGSKENLYVEAWRYSVEKSLRKHPPDGGVPPTDPPEKRIQGRILSIIKRLVDPETHDIDIVHKEMSNPTGLLFDAFSKMTEPVDNAFKGIIKEFLGEGTGDELVDFCFNSIMSQCFIIHIFDARREDLPIPPPNLKIGKMGIEQLADYIIQSVFEGINSFRQKR